MLSPLCQALWLLDEILFPAYRRQTLRSPVFVLAPPRTGSTSLHRAVVADTSLFFAPVLLELLFPFLTVIKALHWLRARPALLNKVTRVLGWLMHTLGLNSSEVSTRHPMGLFREDEDDICLTVHHLTSEIGWVAVSHIESFLWGATLQNRSDATQRRSALLLTRVYQKISFVRGHGRVLCTKSHLVGLAPALLSLHPSARLVTILRPAESSFPSFWSLQCAISRDFGGFESTGPIYLEMRVQFIRELNEAVRRVFGRGVDPGRRVVAFSEFCDAPGQTISVLYDGWGIAHDRQRLASLVDAVMADEKYAHGLGARERFFFFGASVCSRLSFFFQSIDIATWKQIGMKRGNIAAAVDDWFAHYPKQRSAQETGKGLGPLK